MLKIRSCEDLNECASLWAMAWPQNCVFDLWQVRECFATAFERKPYFLIAEEAGKIVGILALSWIDETQSYGHFPGETWRGKTWLEQNKIPARSSQVIKTLLGSVSAPLHLRYLSADSFPEDPFPLAVDEEGFLFFPGRYNFSFNNYMEDFSGKSRKKLKRELTPLQENGISYRYDHFSDIEWLFRMNLEGFGESSYFSDSRFLASYEKLVSWLYDQKLLRITTVLLGGTIAAVDIGTLLNQSYTILAGGTNPEFLGVAKIINFHHLQWACQQRLDVVDFLCGDFGWKKRFHLTSRPLYEIHRHSATARPGLKASPLRQLHEQ